MSLTSISPKIDAAHLPLERLATSTKIDEREKIAEVSKQFEAVLLKQILSQAQKPLFKNSLVGESGSSGAIYQDMVTQQLADRISRGGSFGFAKVLEKELSAQHLKKVPAEAKEQPPARAEVPREDAVKPAEKHVRLRAQPGKRI
jgi:peptidoglycan hydrolase FlgJ